MTKFICFQNPPKIEDRQKLEQEPFYQLNKQKILKDSVCLDSLRFELKIFKKCLINIIYLLNQGIQLDDNEREMIFFRITKLFQYSDIDLKRLYYQVIQMIMADNLDYIILQSLKNDLISNNEYLKSMALGCLKYLKNKTMILQLERFIQQAICDGNQNISNKSIIAGLQLSQFSSNLIKYWETQLENMILNQSPIINYHASVLLCQLKISDINRFISFLTNLIKKPLSPMLNMQIIRFIKDIVFKIDPYHQKLFIQYSLLQIENNEPIVVLEACKIINAIQNLDNNLVEPFISKIFSYLYLRYSNIEVFSAYQLLIKILSNPQSLHYLTPSRLQSIQNHIANYRCHISSRAHYLYTYLQEDKENLAYCFKSNFYLRNIFKFKLNYFAGMFEFIIENPIYGKQVIEFMHLVFHKLTSKLLFNEAIKILFYIFLYSNTQKQLIISTLIWIAELSDMYNKFKVVVFINRFVNNISYEKMEIEEVIQELANIKLQFEKYDFNMIDSILNQYHISAEGLQNIQIYWEYIEQISHVTYQ